MNTQPADLRVRGLRAFACDAAATSRLARVIGRTLRRAAGLGLVGGMARVIETRGNVARHAGLSRGNTRRSVAGSGSDDPRAHGKPPSAASRAL